MEKYKFSELKPGDCFKYNRSSSTIWCVIYVNDNKRIFIISSGKREVKVEPFELYHGDREVYRIN